MTLAEKFGISDVGLAQICDRHRVPIPQKGEPAERLRHAGPGPTRGEAAPQQSLLHENEPSSIGTNYVDGRGGRNFDPLIYRTDDVPCAHVALEISMFVLDYRDAIVPQGQVAATSGGRLGSDSPGTTLAVQKVAMAESPARAAGAEQIDISDDPYVGALQFSPSYIWRFADEKRVLTYLLSDSGDKAWTEQQKKCIQVCIVGNIERNRFKFCRSLFRRR